ncbi:MAG: response regulator [Pleurocapsa minor GSE-CHR-MK-17-07R]|jgi:CheY-like chemotaxis protein|nr:response regulator [Pleurocapsa minor GSE-CHR-MK 17-07R]
MRILYVEDNPANISLLQRVARMGGHEVVNYTEGEKALANFKTDNPDLVLMDLQLAGAMTGLEVVRRLRADGVRTPIVAVTAYAMVGDREKCLAAGCDGYMSKPLPVAELVELVQKYEVIVKASPQHAYAPVAPETNPAAAIPVTAAAAPLMERIEGASSREKSARAKDKSKSLSPQPKASTPEPPADAPTAPDKPALPPDATLPDKQVLINAATPKASE